MIDPVSCSLRARFWHPLQCHHSSISTWTILCYGSRKHTLHRTRWHQVWWRIISDTLTTENETRKIRIYAPWIEKGIIISFSIMGSDISKPDGDDPTKRRGGFFGFGGSQKNGMHNSREDLRKVRFFVVRILFRGMKGVGKTSLFDVFQGKACPEQYTPSKEINTAHVFWTNPTTKDRVKVRTNELEWFLRRLKSGTS